MCPSLFSKFQESLRDFDVRQSVNLRKGVEADIQEFVLPGNMGKTVNDPSRFVVTPVSEGV
jgi:hypothetical protein